MEKITKDLSRLPKVKTTQDVIARFNEVLPLQWGHSFGEITADEQTEETWSVLCTITVKVGEWSISHSGYGTYVIGSSSQELATKVVCERALLETASYFGIPVEIEESKTKEEAVIEEPIDLQQELIALGNKAGFKTVEDWCSVIEKFSGGTSRSENYITLSNIQAFIDFIKAGID